MSAIEAASVACKTMADGTLRVTFDIEPRHAQQAFALFGSPGVPAALARLVVGAQPEPEPEKPKRERMGPMCEWAVYRCKEDAFQHWIRPVYDRVMGGDGSGWGDVSPDEDFAGATAAQRLENYAAHCIKVICEVDSRKHLDRADKKDDFKRLVIEPYRAWAAKQPEIKGVEA